MERALSRFEQWRDRADELASSWKTPALLFGLALTVKAIYVIASNDSLAIRVPIMDGKHYDEVARDIAAGNVVRPSAFFMGPLYPYVLGIVYSIFGRDFLVVRLLQAMGGALTVAMTFALGRLVFRPSVALAGSLVLVLYGAMTFYEGQMLMMWMGTLLNVCGLVTLIAASRRDKIWRFAGAGALFGLSALARANVLLFAPLAAVWILRGGAARRRLAALAFAGSTAVVILPATIHNYVASRDFVLVTSNAGVNFYIGNSRIAKGYFYPPADADFMEDATTRSYIERVLGRDLKPAQVSRYWISRALADMREDPARAVGLMARKLAMFCNGYEIPQIESFDLARREYTILRLLFVKFWLVAALGFLGLLMTTRRSRDRALLGVFVLTYALSIVLFFVTARYRAQIAPLLCLFAADFLLVWAPASAVTLRRFAAVACATAVAVVLTNPVIFRWDEDILLYREHIHKGRRLNREHRYTEAVEEIDRAVALFPQSAEAYVHRALIHKGAGDHFRAMDDYARAIERQPGIASVHYDLAQTLMLVNAPQKAVDEFRAAIAADPVMIKAHNNLGVALRRLRRYDEAILSFRRVVEIDPKYAKGYNNLGACLAEAGRVDEAIEVFNFAIERFPDYANTYKNLATAYVSLQRPAPAVDAISRYLDLQPDDDDAREMLRKLRIAVGSDTD